MQFFVLFIHGPAAAGKHTIGSLVSERLNLPLFHNHLAVDLVKTLFDFGTEEFIRLREDLWRSSFEAATRTHRSFIFTFQPEVTVDPKLMVKLRSIVEQGGGRVHYVELLCKDDEVERRIGNPSRTKFGKLIDPGIYRELKAQGAFNFPPFPQPLISIDTEQVAPEVAASKIADAVSKIN